MGGLTHPFIEEIFNEHVEDDLPKDKLSLIMNFRFKFQSEGEAEKLRIRLKEIVSARNDLIHHLLMHYDLNSKEGRLNLNAFLDSQHEEISKTQKLLGRILNVQEELRIEALDKLKSGELLPNK